MGEKKPARHRACGAGFLQAGDYGFSIFQRKVYSSAVI